MSSYLENVLKMLMNTERSGRKKDEVEEYVDISLYVDIQNFKSYEHRWLILSIDRLRLWGVVQPSASSIHYVLVDSKTDKEELLHCKFDAAIERFNEEMKKVVGGQT